MSSPAPAPGEGPLEGGLQFDRAEIASTSDSVTRCVACQQPIVERYYHAQGATVCEGCAGRIRDGQQKPPAISLLPAALYGAGAGLVGCILYATIAIVFNLEIGLIAILVGYMVGTAVRRGSKGLGGRPQQILAVLLTYFSITTSYIPVFIHQIRKDPKIVEQAAAKPPKDAPPEKPISAGAAIGILLLIAAAAPFLSLGSGFSALLSLVIIFFGLQRAWMLTGRTELLVMGPYEVTTPQP